MVGGRGGRCMYGSWVPAGCEGGNRGHRRAAEVWPYRTTKRHHPVETSRRAGPVMATAVTVTKAPIGALSPHRVGASVPADDDAEQKTGRGDVARIV